MERATAADDRYGPICLDCGMPKDPQALRCRSCWRASKVPRDRVRRPTGRCACGAPIWKGSKRCRPCYRADTGNVSPPAYRERHKALNRLLFEGGRHGAR